MNLLPPSDDTANDKSDMNYDESTNEKDWIGETTNVFFFFDMSIAAGGGCCPAADGTEKN